MTHFVIIEGRDKDCATIEGEIEHILNSTKKDVSIYSDSSLDEHLDIRHKVNGVEYTGCIWGVKVKNFNYDNLLKIKKHLSVTYEVEGTVFEAIASDFNIVEGDNSACCVWYVEVLPRK